MNLLLNVIIGLIIGRKLREGNTKLLIIAGLLYVVFACVLIAFTIVQKPDYDTGHFYEYNTDGPIELINQNK